MLRSPLRIIVLGALALFLVAPRSAHGQPPVLLTVDVASFGAAPGDGIDDLPGIMQAVQSVTNSPVPVELVFHPGIYDLKPPSGSGGTLFTIANTNGVLIAGNGATLLCHSYLIMTDSKQSDAYVNLFAFQGCSSISVENLTVDMVRAPFTFGVCTAVYAPPAPAPFDSRFFEMLVDAGQLHDGATSVPDLGQMHVDLFTHHDPLGVPNGRLFFHLDSRDPSLPHSFQVINTVPGGPMALHRIKGVANQTQPFNDGPGWRLMTQGLCENGATSLQKTFGTLGAGDFVVAVHHFNQHVCFGFSECDGIHIQDVTIHKYPGKAVWGFSCANLSIEGLELIPHSDLPWPATLTGDGIFLADCRGSASISDSHFEGLFDDGINIHTNLFPVLSSSNEGAGFNIGIPSGHTRAPGWFRMGDQIQFCDPDMRPYAQATITTAATVNGTVLELHFPGAGAVPLDAASNPPTAICNLGWFPTDYTISNCLFRTIRGNGIRLHASALVSECTFQNLTTSAIACGPLWYEGTFTQGFCEGPPVGFLQIRDCDIAATTYGWGFNDLNHGAIQIQTSIERDRLQAITGWRTGTYYSLSQILVDHCTIEEIGGAALTGRDVRGLEVQNCQFGRVGLVGSLLGPAFQAAGGSLLYFDQAGDISIHHNAMLPGGSWTFGPTAVMTGPSMHGTWSQYSNTGF